MAVRERAGGWQADLTRKGVRYRGQFATQQEALQWEADVNAALVAGRALPATPTGDTRGSGVLTLGELYTRTLAKYWKGSKSEDNAVRNAAVALEFFGKNRDVQTITTNDVDLYATHLSAKSLSGSTVNRYLAALSKMLSYARRLDKLDKMPVIERQKEGDARERFLQEREAQALIDLFGHWGLPEEATFVTFLLDTGARLSEAEHVFSYHVGADRVTLGAKGRMGTEAARKNGEWRVVPLTARLRESLPTLMVGRADQPLFSINRNTFRGQYNRAVDHLRLGDDVVIHTLRHTCASWLVQRGVDLRRVKDWMGHKSIETTLRYAKLSPVSLFEAVGVLDNPPQPKPIRPELKVVG